MPPTICCSTRSSGVRFGARAAQCRRRSAPHSCSLTRRMMTMIESWVNGLSGKTPNGATNTGHLGDTTLKGIGNAEGPVNGVPEINLHALVPQALGVNAVPLVFQAGKHVHRIRCQ